MRDGVVRADGGPALEGRPETAAVQDDPLARRLLQRAQGAIQKWPEGFPGFQARVRCGDGTRELAGEVRVFTGGAVESTLPADPLAVWAEATLGTLARASTPCFFKDGAGRFPITFDPDDAHPRGRRVRVHAGDGSLWAYRVDARGRLRLEDRGQGRWRRVIAYDEYVRTCPGRSLPTRLRTVTWDVRADTVREIADVEDAVCRRDHVWLPVRRRAVVDRGPARLVLWLALDGHAWL